MTTRRRERDPDAPSELSTERSAGDALIVPDLPYDDETESAEALKRSAADDAPHK